MIKNPCHLCTEIISNFWLGNYAQQFEMLNCDILIPLDSMNPEVWDLGFRGQVYYCPILDYSILPDDILEDLTSYIVKSLKEGKSVGMFCLGGHGRTGYVAAVVLGKLGIKNPIRYIRKNYCRFAVESKAQLQHLKKLGY